MRFGLWCLFFLLVSQVDLSAQKVFQPKQIEYDYKGIIYKSESTWDFRIHTYGFSIGKTWGEIKTYYKTRYYTADFGMLKHPRERRQNRSVSFGNEGNSTSFAFGKQNSLFLLRAGIGEKRYLTEKSRRKGASIGVNYEGGFTLALLKPYYVEAVFTDEITFANELRKIRYTEETAEKFLEYNSIFGGAGFLHGIGKTTIRPGVHAKLGLHMALGAFDKNVKALEAGVMLDVFPTKIPILVERDEIRNSRYFLNLYLTLQIGKRK